MLLEELDSFTETIVSDACTLLQLTETNSATFLTTDPRVVICARSAYTHVANYLNRDIVFSIHREEYRDEDTTITLRCYPVTKIRSVKLIDDSSLEILTDPDNNESLVALTDYRLVRYKNLVIYNLDKIVDTYYELTRRLNVYIEYDGGWQTSTEVPVLHNALVMQTVANYNRLPALGLGQLQGGGGGQGGGIISMSSSLVDAGQLLDSVKIMLDPFVYYGSAVEV